VTEYFAELFENTGAKAEANYSVSVVDIFGQQFGQYLPKEWRYRSYSDISGKNHSFSLGTGPMPIIALAEVIPSRSPNIGGILYPGNNATNGFNLTSFEITPFEFGSWLGGRVQAFMPTKWLGTSMSRGIPQANDSCVEGFDKFTFIQGSTANAFNFWFIDDWYNVPLFAKRSLQALGVLRRQSSSDTIVIPENQADSPLVQLVNETATEFDQTFNESLWATYPNPFKGYNAAMAGVEELLLVWFSLHGEAKL
jgi:lysophospholipase